MQRFSTKEHSDVRGNKLYYLELSNGQSEHLINIGKKTFDIVTSLITDMNKQPELPLAGNSQLEESKSSPKTTPKNAPKKR